MRLDIFDANNVLRRQLESFGNISRERQVFDSCIDTHFYVWDGHNHNARRREFFDGYKRRDPVADNVYAWLDMMRELIYFTPATQIEVPEWEADDVIGVLARRWIAQGHEVHIHSNDLDYFQIEGAVLDGVRNPTGVERKYIPLYKTLVGDDSDKIKGIYRFGDAMFMALQPYWDQMIEAFNTNDLHWLLDYVPWTKSVKTWLTDSANRDLLAAYWKIVHLWDVPLDLIDKHTHVGLDDRAKGEALLQRFML